MPAVDYIPHFLGGYAVSQIVEKLYEPLSKKYERIKNIPKPGMEIFYEPLGNSIKDLFVDAAGILMQRGISRRRKHLNYTQDKSEL